MRQLTAQPPLGLGSFTALAPRLGTGMYGAVRCCSVHRYIYWWCDISRPHFESSQMYVGVRTRMLGRRPLSELHVPVAERFRVVEWRRELQRSKSAQPGPPPRSPHQYHPQGGDLFRAMFVHQTIKKRTASRPHTHTIGNSTFGRRGWSGRRLEIAGF